MDFAGKVAWITGASSGIGAALARGLAERGAHVVLSGRDAARLEDVAADCGETLILTFDVRDEAALADATAKAIAWKGGVDIAFANAGISQRSRALKTSMQVYRDIIEVDLLAQIAFSQGLIGHMAERGSGALGFISSIAGKVGVPMRTAYSAAKFGLAGYAVFSWSQSLKYRDQPTHALIWGTPSFLFMVVGFGMVSMTGYAHGFWGPAYAIREFGVDKAIAGFFLGGGGALGGFLSIIAGGKVADILKRSNPAGRILIGFATVLLPIPFILLQYTTTSIELFYLWAFMVSLFGSLWVGVAGATAQDLVLPRMRGAATATPASCGRCDVTAGRPGRRGSARARTALPGCRHGRRPRGRRRGPARPGPKR